MLRGKARLEFMALGRERLERLGLLYLVEDGPPANLLYGPWQRRAGRTAKGRLSLEERRARRAQRRAGSP